MPNAAVVYRPIVRSFDRKYAKDAAAHVRAGGHAFVWDGKSKATLVFAEPAKGNEDDFGLWGVYDMGKWRWKLEKDGALRGLATTNVPRDCLWIARRRTERDAIHAGTRRKITFECTTCAACCHDNEVILQEADIARFKDAGRGEFAKAPYAKRHKDGRIILTLLPTEAKPCRHLQKSKRCGIYEIRPHSCSEFPRGSECCLFAREDILSIHDGAAPTEN